MTQMLVNCTMSGSLHIRYWNLTFLNDPIMAQMLVNCTMSSSLHIRHWNLTFSMAQFSPKCYGIAQ
jgi:hypothetical protein